MLVIWAFASHGPQKAGRVKLKATELLERRTNPSKMPDGELSSIDCVLQSCFGRRTCMVGVWIQDHNKRDSALCVGVGRAPGVSAVWYLHDWCGKHGAENGRLVETTKCSAISTPETDATRKVVRM